MSLTWPASKSARPYSESRSAARRRSRGQRREWASMTERTVILDRLHERHPGLTPALGQSYAEAACVCFSRHHQPPVILALNHGFTVEHSTLNFTLPDNRTKNAHANEIDATETGAYGVSLAALETVSGLVAVRRAETLTGADWYVAPNGTDSNDLEGCIRLEVSGINAGTSSDVPT